MLRLKTPLLLPIALSLALLSACKGQEAAPEAARERMTNADSAVAGDSAAKSVPDISPQAAPGVAFNYRYAFVLPDKGIAAVQEQHAQACEKLGPSQCRITGMNYALEDETHITAELDFKLAPELARAFGKEGIAAVEKASGKLVQAAITGEDVGTTISQSEKNSGDLRARLSQVEARLKAGGIGDSERTELTAQASQLRDQLAQEAQTRSTGQAQLASTPMTFNYEGDASFSFGSNPFAEAGASALESLTAMIAIVAMAVGVGLPWLALLLGLVWFWRTRPVRAVVGYVRGKPKVKAEAATSA